MKFIDCHMHYFGDKIDNIKSQINSSKYKDIYLGYQSINYENIDISQHINMCQGGFIMPYCIKETNIKYANNKLLKFAESLNKNNIYFFPFIENNIFEKMDMDNIKGFKEHFYIHNSFQCHERDKSYRYLSDNKKLLILHCDNNIRVDYVKYLIDKYPNMLIQIAHMGIFRNCIAETKYVIDEISNLENIYFDISTVFDKYIIEYAFKLMPERILFGTDIPYIIDSDYMDKYIQFIENCKFTSEEKKKLYYENAEGLINKIN